MKVVILAGGLGTRISEETYLKPKPMVEIGGKPILWHIMKIYSHFGINEFIVCCGYKGYVIKEYFANYFLHTSDVTIDMEDGNISVHKRNAEPLKITLVDTGALTNTAGRLKRVANYLNQDTFCFTYGDGIADVNISELIKVHKQAKNLVTVTSVQPPGRYGSLMLNEGMKKVQGFIEKPVGDGGWISGGFFVAERSVLDKISNDATSWENDVLDEVAKSGELGCYIHNGYWQAMDTLREKNILEKLWSDGKAPWKLWD